MGLIVKTSSLLHNCLSAYTSYLKMNNAFDWTLIRSFLAALEHGSLLGAARALGSSQPTLGRHIAELESQLKTTLFERTGRGLLPTDMALRLADSARAMEAGAMQLERQALGAQSKIAGAVRISASQPVACVLLPPLLAQMRIALPEITVELVVSNEVSNLLKREADIALRMVQPDQGSVIARRVGQVTIGTYAHRDYLRRRGMPKQPADLLQHDLISGDKDDALERGAAAMGLTLPPERIVLRTDDLIAYSAAVRAGLGVGFISDYIGRADNTLVPLLPMLQIPPLPLWLVVHREIRSNRRIKAVYDFLAAHLPKAL
jgi:DNA-binding transcriptional LysR family regulator